MCLMFKYCLDRHATSEPIQAKSHSSAPILGVRNVSPVLTNSPGMLAYTTTTTTTVPLPSQRRAEPTITMAILWMKTWNPDTPDTREDKAKTCLKLSVVSERRRKRGVGLTVMMKYVSQYPHVSRTVLIVSFILSTFNI